MAEKSESAKATTASTKATAKAAPGGGNGGAPDPDLGYEQARDELAGIVSLLEAGGTTLEESLALWERGEELATICQRWLDGARERLAAARADHQTPTE